VYCKLQSADHSFRVMPDGGEKVHAARKSHNSFITACGHYGDMYWIKLRRTAEITCKTCQRALAFETKPQDDKRYVIYDTTTKLYFLRRDGAGLWIEEAFGASRWRNYDTAEATRGEILSHRAWGSKLTVPDYIDKYGGNLVVKKAKIIIEIL